MIPTAKHGGAGIMLQGGFSAADPGGLVEGGGEVNEAKHKEGQSVSICKRTFIFHQESDPKHKTKAGQKCQ